MKLNITMSRMKSAAMILAVIVNSLSFSFGALPAGKAFPVLASDIGLLINFSVPCDLNSAIAIPDYGGLLTPVLLGVGYQEYRYDGSKWNLVDENALLFNKSLVEVGSLFATSPFSTDAGTVTFKLLPSTAYSSEATVTATVTATTTVSVQQPFAIPLQLLSTTGAVNQSAYAPSDYVQRFGTQSGLPPGSSYNAKAGDLFKSRFSAFYAFFLPFADSPQLATRVPRCGDERFYGLQYGRGYP